MASKKPISKRVQIDKATAKMVAVIAVASFLTVFSVVACKALLNQQAYQSRVIKGKQEAKKKLEANIQAADALSASYKQFIAPSVNVIGGSTAGTGDRDGDNAKIVLDALPSKYDFPALATSMNKLIKDFKNGTVSGTDDEVAQNTKPPEASPQPVEVPFQFSISSNYQSAVGFIDTLQKTIRPIKINTMSVSASANEVSISVSVITYYQPSKSLNITTKVIK